MRLSAFNLYVDDFPSPGKTLVHNTFSGAYAVLDPGTLAALEAQPAPVELSQLSSATLAELADPDVGIVVASLDDEAREYQSWFEQRRSRRALTCLVSINLACNFDCPYCCQADIMDGTVMPAATAAATAGWIAARALAISAQSVDLVFTGGEPLLHPERIKAIAGAVHEQLAPHGLELTTGLISNGYLLDDAMVRSLLPYGLARAQITLDGDEHTHPRTRVSKRNENTFERIFANLLSASRHIRVTVNGNYREDTIAGFGRLLVRLGQAGLPAHTPVSFSPALATLGAPASSASGCTWSTSAFEHAISLHDEIVRHGYTAPSLGAVGPCGFHDRHTVAIDPRGNLYKCPGFLGHEHWRIGHVASGLDEGYERMLAVDPQHGCGRCAHRPSCAGGCVASEMLRTAGASVTSCERAYLDGVQRHAVIRSYLLASHDDRQQAIATFPPPPVALPADSRPRHAPGGRRPAALRVAP